MDPNQNPPQDPSQPVQPPPQTPAQNPTTQVFNSQTPQQPPASGPSSPEQKKSGFPKILFFLMALPIIIGFGAILVSMFIITANPKNQFAQADNVRRRSDIIGILNSIGAYSADNGSLPTALSALPKGVPTDISKTGADICSDLINNYIPALPQDPITGTGTSVSDCDSNYDTGYYVKVDANGTVTVSAPHAENGEKIQDSRTLTDQNSQTDTSTWKTYKNAKYGFEFKYPTEYIQESGGSLEETSFATKGNTISFSVKNVSFKDYTFLDIGAVTYKYDVVNKTWTDNAINKNEDTTPKKLNLPFEAYQTGIGDGACGGPIIIIPSPKYDFVIELNNIACAIYFNEKNEQVDNTYQLSTDLLLSTFKFTQ